MDSDRASSPNQSPSTRRPARTLRHHLRLTERVSMGGLPQGLWASWLNLSTFQSMATSSVLEGYACGAVKCWLDHGGEGSGPSGSSASSTEAAGPPGRSQMARRGLSKRSAGTRLAPAGVFMDSIGSRAAMGATLPFIADAGNDTACVAVEARVRRLAG